MCMHRCVCDRAVLIVIQRMWNVVINRLLFAVILMQCIMILSMSIAVSRVDAR